MAARSLASHFLVPVAACLLGGVAFAQTSLSGNVSDGAGGPLLAGQVYHLTGVVTVPAGTTLTVQPGAILKAANAVRMVIHGDLVGSGTAPNPIVLTSLLDDSAGGDTNGDGVSVGAPGQWQGIDAKPGSRVQLTHADFRFGGANGYAAVWASSGEVVLDRCRIRAFQGPGLDFNNNASGSVSLLDCLFEDNGTFPVIEMRFDHLANCSGNTASGHGTGDYIPFSQASPTVSMSLGVDNLLNGVLVPTTTCAIPAGLSLTFGPGVLVKWGANGRFDVNGSLILDGTPQAPVVITTLADDAFGGDTNKDGFSTSAPGTWQGIDVGSGATASVDHANLRFGGANGYAALWVNGGAADLFDSVVSDFQGAGVDLNNSAGPIRLERNTLRDNGTYPILEAHLDRLVDFKDNRAFGNGTGDYIWINAASPTTSLRIRRRNLLNNVLVLAGGPSIPIGVSLAIEGGISVKWATSARFDVNGELRLEGTPTARVVVTMLADDEFGGDTNKDGPSTSSPGGWQGIDVGPGAHVYMRGTTLRFGGANGYAGLWVASGGTGQVGNSLIRDFLGPAIDLNNNKSPFLIQNCTLIDNGTYPIMEAALEAIPNLRDNRAAGNGVGDYIYVNSASPGVDTVIEPRNLFGNVLVLATGINVGSGVKLTLKAGIAVKWTTSQRLSVSGELDLLGTALEPIHFTRLEDDGILGDTNKDGPSASAPGAWQGIDIGAGAGPSRIEHVRVRYAGANSYPGLWLKSPSASARSVRVEHALGNGFDVTAHAGDAGNWVAFDNGGDGVRLSGGAFDLLHATLAGNGGDGIRKFGAWTGVVRNSIAWGNLGANLLGLVAGEVVATNGDAAFAGSAGNLFADPLFVDPSPAVGDLRLDAASPCIDAAAMAPAMAVILDHGENSRLLDAKGVGTLLPDMGAHEFGLWSMEFNGRPRLGSRMAFRVNGPAGDSTYLFGLLDGSSLMPGLGFLAAGTASLRSLGGAPVGTVYRLAIPFDPALVGAEFGVQTQTVPVGVPAAGAITNLYRGCVGPPLARSPKGKERKTEKPSDTVYVTVENF